MEVEAELFCDTKQPVLGLFAGSPNGGKHFAAKQGKCIFFNSLSEIKGFQS